MEVLTALLSHLEQIGLDWVHKYGCWGLFALSSTVAIYQPIGADLFILGGAGLGINPYLGALAATAGSFLGATIGRWLGSVFGPLLFKKLPMIKEKHIEKAERLFKKYGKWTVAIAAFTPVPLREVSWINGIFKTPLLPFWAFLLLGLIPRYFGEAFLGHTFGSFIQHRFLGTS